MGVVTCTISGVTYLVKNDKSINADKTLEVRGILTITIIDFAGTATFQRGDPIVVSDSVTGPFYRGFIQSDQRSKYGPASTAVDHVLTCFDRGKYYFDKGANTTNYTGWCAGDIVANFVINGQPGQEGATIAAGLHRDSTQADFNTGILTNVAGTLSVGDGCLEMATQGIPVLYTEEVQSDFATGTLTNVQATTDGLKQTSAQAIRVIGATGAFGGKVAFRIWTGSQVIGSNDTFNYEVWVDSGSPSGECSVDFICSDGSTLKGIGNNFDAQGLLPDEDISGFATNRWYARTIPLYPVSFPIYYNPGDYTGKTIVSVSVNIDATKQGTYTVYWRNIYLGSASGSPFFVTTLQQNPPMQALSGNFYTQTVDVVTTYGASAYGVIPTYLRYSPSFSVDAAKILKSSITNWAAIVENNALVALRSSYDGGITFQPCTQIANLAGLLPGQSIAGKSVILEETLVAGTDPTVSPILENVSVDIESAAIATTRNDLTRTFSTATEWNSGTLSSGVVVSTSSWPLADHAITLNGLTRKFDDGNMSGITGWGNDAGAGRYAGPRRGTLELQTYDFANEDAKAQLNFVGNWQNFTAAVDLVDFASGVYAEAGFVYRTTHWEDANNTYAYTATMTLNAAPDFFVLAKGSNSSTPSSTRLATPTNPVSGGTNHRLKIIINGNNHKLFLDDVQYINQNDSSYTATGGVGLRFYQAGDVSNTTVGDARFANFGIVQATSGTWTSPSISLSSVGTYGLSSICWRNDVASTDAVVLVEASINGGSTYTAVTNGGSIPGLTLGQSLSGVSLLIRITLSTQQVIALPAVSGLRISVSNQYVALAATRSTKPFGIDYVDRANQSGFGTASDGQAWTPVGTGTAAVASNALTITNTTGDFFERLGSRADDDMDMTVPFMLSASTMTGGMTLRYVDSNNYYKLQASTTSIDIIKKVSGVSYTLQSVSSTLAINTQYYMRFRVVDQLPVLLFGRIWLAGTLEDQENWTINTSD